MKYDESDNVLVRGSRFLTDKVSSLFGKWAVRFIVYTLEISLQLTVLGKFILVSISFYTKLCILDGKGQ